ncbi:MAG: choice-of-anchor B family protein [Thermoanaerobaculia bacterium]
MRMRSLFLTVLALFALPAVLTAAIQGPVPCEGGTAGRYPCRAIDQASFIPIEELSNAANEVAGDVLGWHDEASGREFALLALRTRISIVEVTDPESPVILGDLARETEGLSSMAIFEDHLYGIAGAKLYIYDLTRLLTASGPLAADAAIDLPTPAGRISINRETGFAYLFPGGVFPGNIVALDLNGDPENPQQVMAWNPTSPAPRNLECVLYHGPDKRFTGHEICFGGAGYSYLVIYDVTDKAHPVRLSSTKYKHSNTPRDTAVTEDHRFLLLADSHDENLPGGNTRTFLWDLSSLTRPVYFKSYDGTTRARDLQLEIRGRFAYLANAASGLRILDLRQIGAKKSRVREAAYFDVEPGLSNTSWFGAWSVDILPSGTVLVGSIRQGLFVLVPRL